MTDAEQREAARQFINKWANGGDEKQDCHPYWLGMLQNVLGVANAIDYIQFEKPVKLPEGDGKIHTRYIDGYIKDVKALIEQKGSSHKLDEKEPQSGGEMLTPYEQAKRYNDNLPSSEKARWIVTCNFAELWIYDMDTVVPEPVKIALPDLQSKYPLLDFLVKKETKALSHEMEVSIKAGDIVGLIYDAFLKQYGISETGSKDESEAEKEKREHKLRSLNALCVRLVFLFYAEDAGIFERAQFHDYLESFAAPNCRNALVRLFRILDTPIAEREEYLEENLAAFPYVNGGLFRDENIIIPQISEEIRSLLLNKASENFNWRDISPTIFGAVFESTLNPETRRAGGMHYTSVENIHKVIDPLFLDDLKAEFKEICAISQPRSKKNKLDAFQQKLSSIVCLDPAAGSGNFLTESYLSLRRLENQVIYEKTAGQMSFAHEDGGLIQVSIQQFYGIEINDFAVTVAKTALWIAESQMLEETKELIYGFNQDFLPLKTYVNITEGNALRLDWNDVVPKEKLSYIMGNPPFVGYSLQSKAQKEDILSVYVDEKGKPYKTAGKIDYVAGWYFKAAQLMEGTSIRTALVSTNSITQGEQVAGIWKPLYDRFGIHIDFAYRTFIWDSEASLKAHVHCVIVGFSVAANPAKHRIYVDGSVKEAENINAYLVAAENVFIEARTKPICDVPILQNGGKPTEGGHLILTIDEYRELVRKEPLSEQFIRPYMMGKDFIQRKPRYCLWLVGANPASLKKCPEVMKRVDAVKQFRLASPKEATRRKAETPMLFDEVRECSSAYVAIPKVSSENRRYIPMEYLSKEIIPGDSIFMMQNATLYSFGILTSNVHMAWMRAVCGRLKSDYRYSGNIVYNNFPWPSPTDTQKQKIEQTAQAILDARALYPDSSLADLYDELTMPPELRKAHQLNDKAVMQAYDFDIKTTTESSCVAELMKMYQQLTEKK